MQTRSHTSSSPCLCPLSPNIPVIFKMDPKNLSFRDALTSIFFSFPVWWPVVAKLTMSKVSDIKKQWFYYVHTFVWGECNNHNTMETRHDFVDQNFLCSTMIGVLAEWLEELEMAAAAQLETDVWGLQSAVSWMTGILFHTC